MPTIHTIYQMVTAMIVMQYVCSSHATEYIVILITMMMMMMMIIIQAIYKEDGDISNITGSRKIRFIMTNNSFS